METQTANLSIAAFDSLPAHIKDWLSSTQATHLVMEINGRLGLKDEKATIIPSLIFRLVTQDLNPLDFINELSYELNISFQAAKSIAGDIETNVLKPIENELRRDVGVDVKLIYFGQPTMKRKEEREEGKAVAAAAGPTLEPAPMPPTALITPPSPPSPPSPLTPPALPKPEKPKEPTVSLKSFEVKEEEAPFILHQETAPSAPTVPSGPAGGLKIKPELNIKIKDYYQIPPEKTAQKPISVKIETPSPDKAQNKQQKLRVVHYHGLRTPINNSGRPAETPDENTIDLRKFFKK